MNFVKFTETNDHEGESWNFWLQLDGNEDQLNELEAWLDMFDDYGEYYSLDMIPVPELEVDILVKHSDSGYTYYENKVTGEFTCPTPTDVGEGDGIKWLNDHFYKGGIARCFK